MCEFDINLQHSQNGKEIWEKVVLENLNRYCENNIRVAVL